MLESVTIAKIVKALEQAPEKHLAILDLLNQHTSTKGEIDYKTLSNMQSEVNLAEAEAEAYIHSTEMAVQALQNIKSIPEGSCL